MHGNMEWLIKQLIDCILALPNLQYLVLHCLLVNWIVGCKVNILSRTLSDL
jgi:hypothetical protein